MTRKKLMIPSKYQEEKMLKCYLEGLLRGFGIAQFDTYRSMAPDKGGKHLLSKVIDTNDKTIGDFLGRKQIEIEQNHMPTSSDIETNKYPAPNEANWPKNAKLSKDAFIISAGRLGEITSDGLRGYICTVCGKIITEAHHIKPLTYKVWYHEQVFYLERHICDDCMEKSN